MEHTLYLHIGMPKTGTTAIQQFLYDNNMLLEKYGFCYPDINTETGIKRKNDKFKGKNGNVFIDSKGLLLDEKSEDWNQIFKCLEMNLNDKDVIISEEALWGKQNIVDFLKKISHVARNIKIIIYLRRQDLFYESMWKQRIKATGRESRGLEDYITRSKKTNYHKTLNEICSCVGEKNVFVKIYEQSQLYKNDIGLDFLKTIGIDADNVNYISTKKKNYTLDGWNIEFKRMVNMFSSKKRGVYNNWELNNYLLGDNPERISFMNSDTRKKILEECEISNNQVAQHYFGRKELFLEPVKWEFDIVRFDFIEKIIIFCWARKWQFNAKCLINCKSMNDILTRHKTVLLVKAKKMIEKKRNGEKLYR